MKNKPVLAIIGGGASGMTAAIFAARKSSDKIKIIILEGMDRVGKKILATGNGRCNFSNTLTTSMNFHGKSPEFTEYALTMFSPFSAMDFFSEIGVYSKEEENGKLYPYSDQASSVLDALRLELDRLGIEIKAGFKVDNILPQKQGFRIESKEGESLFAKRVIVATGGCASPKLGSDGSGFKLLKALGHKVTRLTPALVQLKTVEKDVRSLQGIKFNGCVSVYDGATEIGKEYGEVLFTDYGLSGPPIFQLSGLFHSHRNMRVELDFMPECNSKQVYDILEERKGRLAHLSCENYFLGLFNKKIGHMIAKRAGVEKLSIPVNKLDRDILWAMVKLIKGLSFNIEATNGFNNAQVTAGGALTAEFDERTMQSRIIKGLYCTGEVLDIFGDCGGYNLQWAYSSAYVAAEAVVEDMLGNMRV